MKELKFRVWSKKQKTYDYKHPYNTLGNFYINQNGCLFSDFGNAVTPEIRQKDFVIEQYTGLKDKNGKEIYDGDIVRWKHIYHFLLCGTGESKEYTERVYWEEKDASFVVGDWFEPLGHLVEEDDIEVIGNIHENPELCGEEEE